MRHPLFRAVVLMGATLPVACGSSEDEGAKIDAGGETAVADGATIDTGAASDATDSDSAVMETSVMETSVMETSAMGDVCPDGAEPGDCGCFPCIK